MKRATILSLVCFALAAPVLAVFPAPGNPPLPAKSRGVVEKVSEGKVTEFVSGRFLTIAMEGERSQTFRLDEKDVAANIDPGVAVGSQVRVLDSRDAAGQRTFTVSLAVAPAQSR